MKNLAETASDLATIVREKLALHFDPRWGSPFWLKRAEQLGFNPLNEIRTNQDLAAFGLMEPTMLRGLPVEHFVPKSVFSKPGRLLVCQTGGTLGRPVWTVYRQDEFEAAFVDPFVAAARHVGFPEGKPWLFAGPSGPHVIGRAAEAIARRTGSAGPFMVDFDPRWARTLEAGSFASNRYLDHVVRQAMDIINTQNVRVIFTTPALLGELAQRMTASRRQKIEGVHYGGQSLTSDELARFQEEGFPNAVHLSGYGNTLFGCSLELDARAGRSLRYYPHGPRLIFGTMSDDARGADSLTYAAAGTEGRVVFSRFDDSMLMINMVERDHGRLVRPPTGAPEGFSGFGIDSPRVSASSHERTGVCLY